MKIDKFVMASEQKKTVPLFKNKMTSGGIGIPACACFNVLQNARTGRDACPTNTNYFDVISRSPRRSNPAICEIASSRTPANDIEKISPIPLRWRRGAQRAG